MFPVFKKDKFLHGKAQAAVLKKSAMEIGNNFHKNSQGQSGNQNISIHKDL